VNLKVVSKTTKCRDFTVIFSIFKNMHRDFAHFYHDFLTALPITEDVIFKHSLGNYQIPHLQHISKCLLLNSVSSKNT